MSVKTPEEFSFKVDQWQEWKRKFLRFRSVTLLDHDSQERQINALLYIMGQSADDICQQLNLGSKVTVAAEGGGTTERDRNFEEVIAAFDNYFEPRSNYRHYRIQFSRRNQLSGESSETYIRELYALASKCNFEQASSKEDRIADQLLAGMADRDLSMELQIDTLTLDAIVGRLRAKEMLVNNQKSLEVDIVKRTQSGSVSSTVGTTPKVNSAQGQSKTGSWSQKMISCTNCGRNHVVRQCPAYGKTCSFCKKLNHFARCCRQRTNVSDVAIESQVGSVVAEGEGFTVQGIINCIDPHGNVWHEEILFSESRMISFKVDRSTSQFG